MSRSIIALVLTAVSAVGAGELNGAIDHVFSTYVEPDHPGCAAGVIHNGEYFYRVGYGMANLEHGIPISSRSVFRIGSLSKQFTAMSIAILAERDELDLDADVHEFLPDLVDYGHELTIRQMLHHIAGMGDYDHEAFVDRNGDAFRFGNEDYWTIDEFYAAVTQADLIHPPGTKYEYSNLAYFLLGQVVERVSGKTLREFADAEIFGPLGMKHSFFNDNVNQPVPNRADAYKRLEDGSYEIFMTNLDFVGDGGVYTTLDDFIRWDRNYYDNKLGSGGPGLIDVMTTPHPDAVVEGTDGLDFGYAFGLRIGELNGEQAVWHTGGWVGFSTVYQRYPELSLSVVVFCNATDLDAGDIGDEIAAVAVSSIRKK